MMNTDFYRIDDLLQSDEILFRDTIRQFVDDKIIPIIDENYQNGNFPMEILSDLASLGAFGITIPTEFGGSESSYLNYGLAMQELERGDSAVRSFASVQSSLVMFPIFKFGSDDQKKKWLPDLASAMKIGCFGLTEPDFGSNPSGMITNAKETPNGYMLNGAKMWITNGTLADIALVWAKLDGVIRGFLVEKGTPGFSAVKIKDKFGVRASETAELIFDNVRVSEDQVIGQVGQGFKQAMQILDGGRISIAALSCGVARGAYEAALQYAQEREQFGQSISKFQAIAFKLADMATEVEAAELLTLQAADLKNRKKPLTKEGAFAKYFASEVAVKCGNEAMQIMGGYGYTKEYPAEKFLRDARLMTIGEGTSEIQKIVISREILK